MLDYKMLRSFIWLSILSICSGLPSITPQNVIVVPPNCPEGQTWVNGACRDIWIRGVANAEPFKVASDLDTQNMITVPQNCPPGQQWINGQCRDVWRGGDLPFSNQNEALETQIADGQTSDLESIKIPLRIINVPNQCPIGYRLDALGICRRIL